MQTFSYYLEYESPGVEGILWSTLAVANDIGAKILLISEMERGILFIFDKEILQYKVTDLLMETIATEGFYTH